jgi:hypothetical protein
MEGDIEADETWKVKESKVDPTAHEVNMKKS